MTIFIFLSAIIYTIIIAGIFFGVNRNRYKGNKSRATVTVIVPARNEESTLNDCLEALAGQSYPAENVQVFLVDDFSSDQTLSIAAAYADRFDRFKIIQRQRDFSGLTPKKSAIAQGIAASKNDIIMNTDADCQPHYHWIESINKYFDVKVGAVSSWLFVQPDHRLFSFIESIDSFSYVLLGAAAIGWGKPLLANGANFSYRKDLFHKINGFDGIGKFGSGDDDLLLQKMVSNTNYKICFALEPDAAVRTRPCPSIGKFLKQRIRWASKISLYSTTLGWLFLPLVVYLLLFISTPFIMLGWPKLVLPLATFWFIKFFADYLVQFHFRRKLGLETPVLCFISASLLQLVYLPIIGLWGIRGRFEWKDRSYIKGKLEQELTKK